MAELQPPEGRINGSGASAGPSTEAVVVTKRQRRPSVRLGDIGDQNTGISHDALARRTKQWHDYKHKKEPGGVMGKGSKTRNLMNFKSGGEFRETLEVGEEKDGNCDGVAIGSWKVKDSKSRRGGSAKRVRSNWVSNVEEGGGGGIVGEGDDKFSGDGEDIDDEYHRGFEPEGSDSPLKEQSPIQSSERGHGNERDVHLHGQRRTYGSRVLEGTRDQDSIELEEPSDTDARDWKCGTSTHMNTNGRRGRFRSTEDGVRIWLDGLGLGRYAPVFEIHEVDDEVLPMLTLEDLKDMGINAVGSRRKMFSAIQKLGKGFS